MRNTRSVIESSAPHFGEAIAQRLMQVSIRGRRGKVVDLGDGRPVVEFINCSYLGLDQDERVLARAKEALDQWGAHFCCARSRFSIGTLTEVEERLSRLFGAPATTFPSVSSAHLSALPLIADGALLGSPGRGVRLVFDRFAHASMQFLKPILAQSATVTGIAHNDVPALRHELALADAQGERCVYVADGVYSMGGLCPVAELLELVEERGLSLYLDDAHGTSIFGERGEGWARSQIPGPLPKDVFITFSLSKGFGCNGGGILVPTLEQQHTLRCFGQSFAFSGPLDFSMAGAVLAAIDLHEDGGLRALQERLRENVRRFDAGMGMPHGSEAFSPIRMVPVEGGTPEAALERGKRLLARGYFVSVAFFPVVPRNQAQLRVCVSATHSHEQIDGLCDALRATR